MFYGVLCDLMLCCGVLWCVELFYGVLWVHCIVVVFYDVLCVSYGVLCCLMVR